VADVLQEAKSRCPDLARLAHITVKGDLSRDALRITRRQDGAGIDAPRMRPEEAAVLAEELTQQWVGISLGTFLSVDWAFMTDLIPKAEAGRYMGVSNIATASAGLIARPILGPIIDAFNNNRSSAVGYRVMFGIVTGFFLIALLTLQPVREIKVE